MVVLPVLFLLGSLFLCGQVEAQTTASELLKSAALSFEGPLTCDSWDCNCTFTRQRGCCCAANDLFKLEDYLLDKIGSLTYKFEDLYMSVTSLAASMKISFMAKMDPNQAIILPGTNKPCFGPFNTNVPIPYRINTLNDGNGYNAALGVFAAPRRGVYVFSITVYSSVDEGDRLHHKVQLIWNSNPIAGVWESNREDSEDSATQVVVLELNGGDQVYVELILGRKLCTYLEYNIFTGYMLYPIDP